MSIVEKYMAFKRQKEEMLGKFRMNFENDLSSYLEEHYPDLEEFLICGWTPEFNDGDVCEHGHQVYLVASHVGESDHWEEEYADLIGENLEENSRLINPEIKTKERYDEIVEFLEHVADMLFEVYGTNQQMRKSGKGASVEVKEYDCGY